VKYDPFLASIMDPSRATSLTNIQTTTLSRVGTLKRKYGFLAPTSTTTFRVAKTT
jgi:hypothetical protein